MRILLSHHSLEAFAGTESYMVTVAQRLEQLGHEALLYGTRVGAMGDAARRQGLTVLGGERSLPPSVDAVLAQDAPTALEFAQRYPDAARVFVAHSDYHAIQFVPQMDGVCHAVVVMNDRLREFVERMAHHPPVARLRQPVDLARFVSPIPAPRRARRVLVLSNYLRGSRLRMIEAACQEAGLEVVVAGIHGRSTAEPERLVAQADVVIALGRGALEGMASQRAVYVYGIAGGDGWVAGDSYPAMEADGFSGRASDLIVDKRRLVGDLADWHDDMGRLNFELASTHHDAAEHTAALVGVVRSVGTPEPAAPFPAQEMARLARLEWVAWARAVAATRETREAREQCEALREEARAAHEDARAVRERMDKLDAALLRVEQERDEARRALQAAELRIADARPRGWSRR